MPLSKITSIVNVIKLKLFTLISIVYKYGTLDIIIYIYIYIYIYIQDWKQHAYYTESIGMVYRHSGLPSTGARLAMV